MVTWNPYDHEHAADPYPIFRQLRDEAPVYHNAETGFFALSRFDDVLNAHLDPKTFSSAHGVTIEGIDDGMPFLLTQDPPGHAWHRKIVSRVFTPRHIGALESFIRQTAADLLDQHVDSAGFDAVDDFSVRLPLNVIGELLDIPPAMREEVHTLSDVLNARDGSSTTPEAAMKASDDIRGLFSSLIREKRKAPGSDVVSLLMTTEVVDDDGQTHSLTDEELSYRFLELAFAGHETVAKLIGNGIVALAWYPEQRAELVEDPGLIPQAVEELLRWDTTSYYQGRWSTREVELHGTTIPADSRVVLLTGSAAHDERQFDDPELFDIHRNFDRHTSLGFGIHLCLGAALARLEMKVALEELLARYPTYALAEEGIERQFGSNVRGLMHLPITYARATVSP